MVECGDQVRCLTVGASARTSDRLAVQGDHAALVDGEGSRPHPHAQCPVEGVGIDAGEQFP